jgi:hypothetical protein
MSNASKLHNAVARGTYHRHMPSVLCAHQQVGEQYCQHTAPDGKAVFRQQLKKLIVGVKIGFHRVVPALI